MPSLSIRKLDETVYQGLRLQAAQKGVSMEEEVRQILTKNVEAKESIVELAQRLFGKENGVDLEIPPRKENQRPVDLF